MARGREVNDLLLQLNHEVDHLPEATLRRLAPVLREARLELEKDLSKWLASANGEERFTAQHLRVALIQVREASKAVERVAPELRKGLIAGASRASALAQAHLEREATFFSTRFGKSLIQIPVLEAGKVIDGMLLDRFKRSTERWPVNVRNNIRQRLAVSLVKHETVEQMQRRLVGRSAKYLSPLATQEQKARVVSRVLWNQAEADARRIVRTEVINAYNSVKEDSIVELAGGDPKWGKRWDAALDGRVCPNCRALDGVVVPSNANFPWGVSAPPLHPNCRCAVVAWHTDWEHAGSAVRREFVAPEKRERPKRSSKAPR